MKKRYAQLSLFITSLIGGASLLLSLGASACSLTRAAHEPALLKVPAQAPADSRRPTSITPKPTA